MYASTVHSTRTNITVKMSASSIIPLVKLDNFQINFILPLEKESSICYSRLL